MAAVRQALTPRCPTAPGAAPVADDSRNERWVLAFALSYWFEPVGCAGDKLVNEVLCCAGPEAVDSSGAVDATKRILELSGGVLDMHVVAAKVWASGRLIDRAHQHEVDAWSVEANLR